MKKQIKVFGILCASALAISVVAGCNRVKPPEDDGGTGGYKPPVFEESGYKLIDGGVSEYLVVLPANPVPNEYVAAEELNYFLKAATGAELPVVREDQFTITQSSSVVCIGDTAYADEKDIKTDGSLGRSGYIMKTVENQLFIRSDGDGMGCVYAVYDLLESAIGYRYYHKEEIYYEKKDTVELYDYDIVADPSFDFRAISTWNAYLYANPDYMRRTRTVKKSEGFAWSEMHTQTGIHQSTSGVVPKATWFASHKYGTMKGLKPDHWFSPLGDQLCWTAGEEMYEQAAKDVFEMAKTDPDARYFEIGQADTVNACTCNRCKEARNTWAKNDAGLQMHFLNRVAYYLNPMIEEEFPGREIRLVAFAYYFTETAPVKQENGKWVAYSKEVEPEYDNIDFFFTPIGADYSKGLTDVENQDVYNNLKQWSEFLEGRKNQLMLYTYDTNFHYFFYNFNNFATFGMQAKTYSEMGVDFIHSQGANNTNQPCFQEMRYFVKSQILWDTSRSYDDLANEFMLHFYKDASAEIREYYDLTRMRYEQVAVLEGKTFNTIYSNIGDRDIWTEGVVDAIDKIFARAYQKIEHYKTEDPDMYTKLYDRIKELELTNTYTKLMYYTSSYTKKEVNALVDEYNYYILKFDINRYREGSTFATAGLFDSLKG